MTALTARIRFFICGFAIFAAVIILHSRRAMTSCVRAFIGHIHKMPFQFPFSHERARRSERCAFGVALAALSSKGLKAFTAATVSLRFPCVYYHGHYQSGAALQTLRVFKRENLFIHGVHRIIGNAKSSQGRTA